MSLRRRALLLALALVLPLTATPLGAQDLASDWRVVEDAPGTMDVATVGAFQAAPATALLSRGFTRSTWWLGFALAGRAPEADGTGALPNQLVIRIPQVFIDEIELFDPADASGRRRLAGDRVTATDAYESSGHAFLVPVTAETRVLWLRVRSRGIVQMHVQVLPLDQAVRLDRGAARLGAGGVTLLGILCAGSAILWWLRRRSTELLFALLQSMNLGLGYYLLVWPHRGLASLSPAMRDTLFSLAFLSLATLSAAFHRHLFYEYGPSRLGRFALTTPVFVSLAILLVALAGRFDIALQLNATQFVLLPLGVVAGVLTCRVEGDRPQAEAPALPRWMRRGTLVWGIVSIVLLHGSLTGWFPPAQIMLFRIAGSLMVTGLLVVSLLVTRTRQERAAREAALVRVQVAEAQRQEQANLVDMLSHEVKTVLSVISVSLGGVPSPAVRTTVGTAIDKLSGIVDLCGDTHRAEGEVAPARDRVAVAPLLEDVRLQASPPDRVRVDVGHQVDAIVTAPDVLRRLLGLLVDNALAHGSLHGPCVVEANLHDDGLVVVVANEPGRSGWPDAARVFTKYYRSPGARRATGSGLGLHLAATLARQLGGTLQYAPTVAQVRFVLWLPR